MSETTYYKYISNGDHYTDVITKLSKVEHHLWIGTADIKDLYVKSSSTTIPFLKPKIRKQSQWQSQLQ